MTETNENTGQATSDKQLSPLEEARLMRDDIKGLLAEVQKERLLIEKTASELALTGRSYGGQVIVAKTQDDIDQEDANKFLRMMK